MPDITLSITINDWRDVPYGTDHAASMRRAIIDSIARHAATAAERVAEDYDVVAAARVEVDE